MDMHIKNIKDLGYTLLTGVFNKSLCEKAKKISLRHINEIKVDYKSYKSDNSLADKSSEKVLNNIQNKDYFFFNFISNNNICDLIGYFLKKGSYKNNEPFHIINTQVRCLDSYGARQQLHMDSNLPGRDSYPIVMVAIVMLDDFTSENGATRVLPKSHLRSDYAKTNKRYKNETHITGKAGDVIIFNGALWHGSDRNKTNKDRWSINMGYARWFIKPSFDIPRSINKNIYDKMTDNEKDLLGLKTVPPKDEFERLTRKSKEYFLPWRNNEI